MAGFSIRNPYFVIVVSLIAAVIGLTSLVRMPVDLFPDINIPEVVVATFYTGMPPEQIETDITGRFERFFTLGAASITWNRGRCRASASSKCSSSRGRAPTPM